MANVGDIVQLKSGGPAMTVNGKRRGAFRGDANYYVLDLVGWDATGRIAELSVWESCVQPVTSSGSAS